VFGVITAKRNMERIQLKVKILQRGSRPAQTAQSVPTATDADTTWRLGMMGALGIFVHNRNTDKESRN
jgi:hypothetical protein